VLSVLKELFSDVVLVLLAPQRIVLVNQGFGLQHWLFSVHGLALGLCRSRLLIFHVLRGPLKQIKEHFLVSQLLSLRFSLRSMSHSLRDSIRVIRFVAGKDISLWWQRLRLFLLIG